MIGQLFQRGHRRRRAKGWRPGDQLERVALNGARRQILVTERCPCELIVFGGRRHLFRRVLLMEMTFLWATICYSDKTQLVADSLLAAS